MPIDNIFNFIDYLETFNRDSGTANENRAFVYNSLSEVFGELDPTFDLYGAYNSIGINIPERTFNDIIDLIGAGRTNGNMVQAFAPNSLIPSEDIPCGKVANGDSFIVWSDALVYNNTTGDSYIRQWWHTWNEPMTVSNLKEEIALSIENHPDYDETVSHVDLLRIYKLC